MQRWSSVGRKVWSHYEVWHFLQAAEEVVRAEPVSPVSPFIDWSALVGSGCLLVGVAGLVFVLPFLCG